MAEQQTLQISIPFTENDEEEVLCDMIAPNGEIHKSFLSKRLLILHGFLEIVNEEDEKNQKVLVVDPPLVVEKIATPTKYTKKDLSTNQFHIEKFKWSKSSIELLIETRAEFDHQFYKNRNNISIWKKIASIMCANGFVIVHSDANDKFRNLMATYRANQDRSSQSGEGAITWEYFGIMKQHFGHKDSFSPKNYQLFESKITDKSGTSTQSIAYNSAPKLAAELKTKISKPTLKRKCQYDLQPPLVNTNVATGRNTTTKVNTTDSDDSDSGILKPVKVKNKKYIPSQILDLLREEKKERVENNKLFFNLMGRLVELEEEKLKVLKSNSTKE